MSYIHTTTIGIGAIVAEVDIEYNISKHYSSTWHEPEEGGELEIEAVVVVGVTGATYAMDRCEFPSWAEILDNLIWDQIEDGHLDHQLYQTAEEDY